MLNCLQMSGDMEMWTKSFTNYRLTFANELDQNLYARLLSRRVVTRRSENFVVLHSILFLNFKTCFARGRNFATV